MEAAKGQKNPLEAKNGIKESIYLKKFLIKVAQQPQKSLDGCNQIWAMTYAFYAIFYSYLFLILSVRIAG